MKTYDLKTAYMRNPMGLDDLHPQLSWKTKDGKKQTAFKIEVSVNDKPWKLMEERRSDSMKTSYSLPLESRDRILWRVAVADENGVYDSWSQPAFFEMGLLEKKEWKASFIMGNYEHSKSPKVRYPVDCFKKTFRIKKENLVRARLYITACGLYETKINGTKVGDAVLTPGSTAFQKRVHYQTYDVTDLLKDENVWTMELADGFYASATGVFDSTKVYGYEPKFMAQMEVFYQSGEHEVFVSDASMQWSNDGSIRYADMKNGERIDLGRSPSYSGRARVTSYEGMVCASNNDAAKEHEKFSNPTIVHCPDGHTVLDFGQNIAGYVKLSVKGEKGAKCRMVCGEKLDTNGNFTVENIAWKANYDTCRFQSVDFVCDGVRHDYKPKFTIMGFRYVLLLDWPEDVDAGRFSAIAVYTDMDTKFSFTSSDAMLNRIVKNTFWSVKGNFMDVPTDCPTRERAGWTGDAQLFFNTGNYMMDQRAFFRKWMRDVADCQKGNGLVYNVNPTGGKKSGLIEWISMEGSAGWGDAMVTIPYYFWKRYGDDCLIRENWQAMEKCIAYFSSRMGKRNLFSLFSPKRSKYDKYLVASGRHFGEWTEPDDCAPSQKMLLLPMVEEATAYLSYAARLMEEMADYLGKESQAKHYKQIADRTKEAYNYYFVQNGDITSKRMCKYVRPCGLELAEGQARQRLLQKIVKLNQERSYRVGTGFLSTPFVFPLLTEAGASDDAFRMLMNPEIGWIQQIKQGATTVWENWTDDASLNHYSKGACCQWLFDTLCGIKMDGRENHFVIDPHPVSQLDSISMEYDSAYGKVSSAWFRTDGKVNFRISIPSNCVADVILPDGSTYVCKCGEYNFFTVAK